MTFKSFDEILRPDPRFVDRIAIGNGIACRMDLESHYAMIVAIQLSDYVPDEVHAAFDRARSVIFYAFFDYDLLMVGEIQSCGAFELALKYRLNDHSGATRSTLSKIVKRARLAGFLPPLDTVAWRDPIQAIIDIRNGLSHGTIDIHSPDLALPVIEVCANWINYIFQPKA